MRARRANPEQAAKVAAAKERHRVSPQGRQWKRRVSQVENHRRRGGSAPFLLRPEQWDEIVAYWENRCAYCQTTPQRLQLEHVVPLGAPGTPGTVPWNVVPACRACNQRKGKRPLVEAFPAAHARVVAFLCGVAPYL